MTKVVKITAKLLTEKNPFLGRYDGVYVAVQKIILINFIDQCKSLP